MNFGSPVNRFDQEMSISLKEQGIKRNATFASFNTEKNSLRIDGSKMVYPDDLGYWKFVYEASETQNGFKYTQEKVFYIIVQKKPELEPTPATDPDGTPVEGRRSYFQIEDIIKEDRGDGRKPVPYVKSFDSKGLMTIGWS